MERVLVLVLEVEGDGDATRSADVAVHLPATATVGMLHEALVGFARGRGLLPRTASAALGLHRAGDRDALAPTDRVLDTGLVSGDRLVLRPVGSRRVGRRPRRPAGGGGEPVEGGADPLDALGPGAGDPEAPLSGTVLDVVGGPDSGTSVALEPGAFTVGRSPRRRVVVHDPTLSRHHLTLQVGAQWGGGLEVLVVPDASARNGVLVDGVPIDQPRPLVPGELLRAGDSAFVVRHVEEGAAAGPPAGGSAGPGPPRRRDLGGVRSAPPRPVGGLGAGRRFARQREAFYEQVERMAVRVGEALRDERAERHSAAPDLAALGRWAATEPPDGGAGGGFGAAGGLAPLRLGLGEAASRVTVGVAPGGTPELRRQAISRLDHHRVVRDVPVSVDLDGAGVLGICGPADQVRAAAGAALLQLAARHRPDDLVIAAAVGEAEPERFAWLKWLPHLRWPTSPLDGPGLAVGPEAAAALVGHVLDLVAERVARPPASAPRPASATVPGTRPRPAAPATAAGPAGGADRRSGGHRPRVVLAVDHEAELPRRLLDRVLDVGPRHGIHVLWFGEPELLVPRQCGAVLICGGSGRRATLRWTVAAGTGTGAATGGRAGEVGDPETREVDLDGSGAVGRDGAGGAGAGAVGDTGGDGDGDGDVELDVDGVQPVTARSIARRLAAGDRHAPPLPRRVGLIVADEAVRPRPGAIAARWRSARTDVLACVPGVTAAGPARVDLARHGPGVLVAGAKGSGKTTTLVALALSLAVRYPPSRVRLVVLDSGPGAGTAVLRDLPHTLRWVAGADGPGAVREALDLATTPPPRVGAGTAAGPGAPGSAATTAAAGSAVTAPDPTSPVAGPGDAAGELPPRLVLLVDDHAALARQVPWAPAVLAGLEGPGGPDRTHLVVASPYRVDVPDRVWARAGVRVALRAPDPAEPLPVVGVPDPAHFPAALRGRAVLRIGTTPPVLLQCAQLPVAPVGDPSSEVGRSPTGAWRRPEPVAAGPAPPVEWAEPPAVAVVSFDVGEPADPGEPQGSTTAAAVVAACRAAAAPGPSPDPG